MYSRMDQVKLVEDSLITSNIYKGCLPQILLGPFWNKLSQMSGLWPTYRKGFELAHWFLREVVNLLTTGSGNMNQTWQMILFLFQ